MFLRISLRRFLSLIKNEKRIFTLCPFYWLNDETVHSRCTWRHLWRKSLVTNPSFSPSRRSTRSSVWETTDVECGKGGRGKSGWSGLRPGETGQPVQTSRSRPNNPVRSLETGRIRGMGRGGEGRGDGLVSIRTSMLHDL